MLRINHLSLVRNGRAILDDVSFEVGVGEVLLVAGHNGAGKSALLKAIFGEVTPTAGEIVGRPDVGGVFYLPQGMTVFPSLTVDEHRRIYSSTDRHAPPDALFSAMALPRDRRAGLLSGGERQWLAASRIAYSEAELILVDELTTGLSPTWRVQLLNTLKSAAGNAGATTLLVEHNVGDAIAIADRLLVLRQGRIAMNADARNLRSDPDKLSNALMS